MRTGSTSYEQAAESVARNYRRKSAAEDSLLTDSAAYSYASLELSPYEDRTFF
jgi:hypothetical protein